jgi:hypothetical protein
MTTHIGNIGFAGFQINEMNARYVGLTPIERFERLGAGAAKPKEVARPGVRVESIRKQAESGGATHDYNTSMSFR